MLTLESDFLNHAHDTEMILGDLSDEQNLDIFEDENSLFSPTANEFQLFMDFDGTLTFSPSTLANALIEIGHENNNTHHTFAPLQESETHTADWFVYNSFFEHRRYVQNDGDILVGINLDVDELFEHDSVSDISTEEYSGIEDLDLYVRQLPNNYDYEPSLKEWLFNCWIRCCLFCIFILCCWVILNSAIGLLMSFIHFFYLYHYYFLLSIATIFNICKYYGILAIEFQKLLDVL